MRTLTSQNVHDQLHVRAELLDVVEVGHRHYWHILVAVHLGDEVHVTGQVFPEDSQERHVRNTATEGGQESTTTTFHRYG